MKGDNEFGQENGAASDSVQSCEWLTDSQTHEYSPVGRGGIRPDAAGAAAGRKVDFRFFPKEWIKFDKTC